jgi:hypothetical protein
MSHRPLNKVRKQLAYDVKETLRLAIASDNIAKGVTHRVFDTLVYEWQLAEELRMYRVADRVYYDVRLTPFGKEMGYYMIRRYQRGEKL